jgi:hypothetical protein
MRTMNANAAIVATAVLVACAQPALASPSYRGHTLVSRDTTEVFRAAGDALERFGDAVLVRLAVGLGGRAVASHLR